MFALAESEWIWERLQKEKRPIILYGMGNGAEKILALCQKFKIPVQDLFASDEFVRGQSFAGFQVKRYEQIRTAYSDPIILIAFGTERPEVLDKIYRIAEEFEVLAPDIPLFGDELIDFPSIKQHQAAIVQVYERLADTTSKKVFQCLLQYKLSGKIRYLQECETTREEALSHLFPLEDKAVYMDLGAYDGDTVEEFIAYTQGKYGKIFALEPDRKNFAKLKRKIEDRHWQHVTLFPYASWSQAAKLIFDGRGGRNSALGERGYEVQAESVDHLLQGKPASFIKMDVEGAEYETLLGCKRTIQQFAPKFAISAYHRSWDFVELPKLLWTLNPHYRIFLRHHPYIPGWETNLYVTE